MRLARIIWGGVAIAAAAGLALAAFYSGAPARVVAPAGAQIVDVRVGEVALRVPAGHLRHAQDRVGGRMDELHLAASAIDFGPPPAPRPLAPGETEAARDTVYLTLQPPETALAPFERMAKLYARFLKRGSEPMQTEGGLMMRAFEPSSPYEHETLYFNPPEGGLFAARCMRPPEDPDGPSALANGCIADFRLQGLDVRLRFSASLLDQWERMTMETTRFIASMAAQ